MKLAVGVVGCLVGVSAVGDDWRSEGRLAWATGIEVSDGGVARLEVDCRGATQIRVSHEVFGELPEEMADHRPGWYRIVRLTGGWGLDLRRREHDGGTVYWWRCAGREDCLRARDPQRILDELRKSWTWYLRAVVPGRSPVDLRVSLVGSRRAIEAACNDGD